MLSLLILLFSGTHKICEPVSKITLNFCELSPISISVANKNEFKISILLLRVSCELSKMLFNILID